MKRVLTILILCSSYFASKAQQTPMFTQYFNDPVLYNPSLAGANEDINASLINREQWVGIAGAPNSTALTIDGPFSNKKIGIGLGIINDATDIFNRLAIKSYYSYRLDINDDNKINFGLSLGYINNKVDFSKVQVKDENDPFLVHTIQQKGNINADFGVTYHWKKALEVGLCVPQILGNNIHFQDNDNESYYQLSRQFQLSAKYIYTINEDKGMSVYPLVLARYTPHAPFQFDFNAVFDWKQYGWAAISYKFQDAIGFNIGVYAFKNIKAGFAYDLTMGKFNGYTGGTTEIYLGYTFGSGNTKSAQQDNSDLDLLKKQVDKNTKDIDSLAQLHKNMPTQTTEKSKPDTNATGAKTNKDTSSNAGVDKSNKGDSVKVKNDSSMDYHIENMPPPATTGYYVVVGAFANKTNAENFRDEVKLQGFSNAKWIYKAKVKIYDVFVARFDDNTSALNKVESIRGQYPKAWILSLK